MRLCRNVLSAVLLLTSWSAALSQTITGSVTGTVKDSSGAVISAATVQVKNDATGTVSTAKSNSVGIFTVPFLSIGSYDMTVNAPGFKSAKLGPFNLEAGQTARLDTVLEIGAGAETVTVTDAAPILNTEDATLGATITATMTRELPLPANNPAALGLLMPGVVQPNPSSLDNVGRAAANGSYDNSFMVNGNREQTNNFTLDGQDLNEAIDNTISYTPNREAIGEIKIISGNGTAEYGNANGGQFVMITKSGTNAFHGSTYWYLENNNLDANSWVNKHVTTGQPLPVSPLNRSIFGGTFGGPLLRNKLFFFGDFQGARQHGSSSAFEGVATAQMRTGYDPITQKTYAITNPVAQYLIAHPELYPLPNQATTNSVSQDYLGTQASFVKNNQGDLKIDWKLRDADQVSGRVSIGRDQEGTTKTILPTDIPSNSNNPYTSFIVNWTHIVSSSLVNEARAGYGRTRVVLYPTDVTGLLGTNGNMKIGIPGTQVFPGISQIVFGGNGNGLASIGPANGGKASESTVNTFSYGDTLSWQLSRHALKFGALFIRYQENRYFSGQDGALGHFNTGGVGANFTGGAWGDFLQNDFTSYGQGSSSGRWGQRQSRPAIFFQDNFRVSSELTLSMGMRWEYDQPLYEVNNKQANIDISTGLITNAGQNGASRALYKPFYAGFMPRMGFSYSPEALRHRFVLNGGYAITEFMEGMGANLRLTLNPPFFTNASGNSNGGLAFHMTDGFPLPANPNTYSGTVRAWDPKLRPSLIQQYDLMTQFELSNTKSLLIAYAGQIGDHLVDPREGNQATCSVNPLPNLPNPCKLPLIGALPLVSQVSYTESEAVMNYNALQTTFRQRVNHGIEFLANYTFSRSFSNNKGYYGAGGTSGPNNYYQDAYNPRAEYGLNFIDTTHLFSFGGYYDLPIGRGKLIGKNLNRVADSALGGWKVGATAQAHTGFPLTLTTTQYYNANQRTNRPNAYRKLKAVGRSDVNWFGTDASAAPCTNNAKNNPAATSTKINGSTIWLSNDNGTCAFGEELTTGFGTSGVSTLRAPGFKDVDMSASKSFAMPFETNLQFRADAFNVLNTVSLGPPVVSVSSTTFGQIASTITTERRIQLSLKYQF
jgi:hypothetical protein